MHLDWLWSLLLHYPVGYMPGVYETPMMVWRW